MNIIKALEHDFKKLLKGALVFLLPESKKTVPPADSIRKILVFRLDQRIGNGLLLLPLLRAIRTSLPPSEIHLLIHHPVAELFRETGGNLIDRVWPYNQPQLMKRPWSYLALFRQLRRERFDIAITSHNPDNFSLSQALAGRFFKPDFLIGFDWKDSSKFYDIAVPSSPQKHYADAMVDLWRVVKPDAMFHPGGLKVPPPTIEAIAEKFPRFAGGGVLVWLGATKRKILPGELFEYIYEQLEENGGLPVHFAAGPADETLLQKYPQWIRDKTIVWKESLVATAAFFSQFHFFVSGDTGPMHLAAALECPTLTIFVDSNIRQYGYHDGEKHFSLFWRGDEEDRRALNRYLTILMNTAEPGNENVSKI